MITCYFVSFDKDLCNIIQDDVFEYDSIVTIDNISKQHWSLLVRCFFISLVDESIVNNST